MNDGGMKRRTLYKVGNEQQQLQDELRSTGQGSMEGFSVQHGCIRRCRWWQGMVVDADAWGGQGQGCAVAKAGGLAQTGAESLQQVTSPLGLVYLMWPAAQGECICACEHTRARAMDQDISRCPIYPKDMVGYGCICRSPISKKV